MIVHDNRQLMSVMRCDGVVRVPLSPGSCDVFNQVLFTQVLHDGIA